MTIRPLLTPGKSAVLIVNVRSNLPLIDFLQARGLSVTLCDRKARGDF
jgi:hypothetical protein